MNTSTFFASFNVTFGNATPMRDLPDLARMILAETVNHMDRNVIVDNFRVSPVTSYTTTVWVRYTAAHQGEAVQIVKDAVAQLRTAGHAIDAIHVRQYATTDNLAVEGVS